MNRIEKGIRTFITRMQKNAGVENLTYFLIADRSQSITLVKKAWYGRQVFRTIEGNTSIVQYSDRDIHIPVEDLVFNGNRILPRRGHWVEIFEPEPKVKVRFELAAPEGEQVYRYMDTYNLVYRIHTRAVLFS